MPAAPDPPSPTPDSAPAARPGFSSSLLAYRRLLGLALAVLVLDQATKSWIVAHLPLHSYGPGRAIAVMRDFFYIVHVGNTGAAWSMFTGRSAVLALLAMLTLVAIYFWRRQLGLQQPRLQIAFGLLVGGIVGNLVDRLAYGHVVDFLDFHFGNYVFPSFNIADSGICVGVCLYLLWSLRQPPSPVD